MQAARKQAWASRQQRSALEMSSREASVGPSSQVSRAQLRSGGGSERQSAGQKPGAGRQAGSHRSIWERGVPSDEQERMAAMASAWALPPSGMPRPRPAQPHHRKSARALWEMTTPLGRPVEPEVNSM
jgi:hypothetical protein